jgi:hypothetical protein
LPLARKTSGKIFVLKASDEESFAGNAELDGMPGCADFDQIAEVDYCRLPYDRPTQAKDALTPGSDKR